MRPGDLIVKDLEQKLMDEWVKSGYSPSFIDSASLGGPDPELLSSLPNHEFFSIVDVAEAEGLIEFNAKNIPLYMDRGKRVYEVIASQYLKWKAEAYFRIHARMFRSH